MSKKPYWFDVVTRPFEWSEIEIKVQSLNKEKTKALPVAYFDARVVRRRLNEAFGPENWSAEHREILDVQGRLVGVVCVLKCEIENGREVVRQDVGVPSAIDPIKGAYSDSLKRAFAALGNDWLYDINLGWHPYTQKSYKPFDDAILLKIRAIYEAQIDHRSKDNPIIVYAPDDGERAPRPARGVRAILEKAGVNGEAFHEEEAEEFPQEKIGTPPPDADERLAEESLL